MTVRLGGRWDGPDSRALRVRTDECSEQWCPIAPPANAEHFEQLMIFANVVLGLCDRLGISPTLSGSLAVLAYTQRSDLIVDDVDLARAEAEFGRLGRALEREGIQCATTAWHVLQAHRDGLKVEFDSTEYWMTGLSNRYRRLDTGRFVIRVVESDDLRELYGRGVRDLEGKSDQAGQRKLRHMKSRWDLLTIADTVED